MDRHVGHVVAEQLTLAGVDTCADLDAVAFEIPDEPPAQGSLARMGWQTLRELMPPRNWAATGCGSRTHMPLGRVYLRPGLVGA